jgi:phage tail-like protein
MKGRRLRQGKLPGTSAEAAKEEKYRGAESHEKESEAMPARARKDPYRNCNFRVEIDGITVAGFMECTGLESETEVVEYREGNEANIVHQLPGLTIYSNIVLKRGVSDSRELYEWRKSVIEGQISRRNGSIILQNDSRQDVVRWNFREGWPCRMSGPDLNALESEIAIEELEICHEGFQRD